LIFKNGETSIRLHADFERPFKELIEQAINNVKWDFQPSCHCDLIQQRKFNAEYYNRRGHFQLRRNAPDQALSYFKEALTLRNTSAYQDDYDMALVAMQQTLRDPILEEWLRQGDDPQLTLLYPADELSDFRHDYLQVVGRDGDSLRRLSARLQEITRFGENTYWSHSMGRWGDEVRLQIDSVLAEDPANTRAELRESSSEHRGESGTDTSRSASTAP
jgi:hypothetical protein